MSLDIHIYIYKSYVLLFIKIVNSRIVPKYLYIYNPLYFLIVTEFEEIKNWCGIIESDNECVFYKCKQVSNLAITFAYATTSYYPPLLVCFSGHIDGNFKASNKVYSKFTSVVNVATNCRNIGLVLGNNLFTDVYINVYWLKVICELYSQLIIYLVTQ